MAQMPNPMPRNHLRDEIRTFLIVSAGAFALGLAIGFAAMGLH